jgi:hypothetical protein
MVENERDRARSQGAWGCCGDDSGAAELGFGWLGGRVKWEIGLMGVEERHVNFSTVVRRNVCTSVVFFDLLVYSPGQEV